MNMLKEARTHIDEIDKQIGQLFEKRMQMVEEVAQYKKKHHLPILDEKREEEVIKRNIERIHNPKYKQGYEQLLEKMMEISRNYQHRLLNEEKEEIYEVCKEKSESCTD